MLKRRFSSMLVAVFVICSLLGQGTLVLAGTTGSINGTVVESGTHTALAGVGVTASASQTASATPDARGHV